jgi:hypothetical protein
MYIFKRSIRVKVILLHPYGSNWLGGMKDISTVFNLMPPLGMMSIAAVLERAGIDAEIIDCYATLQWGYTQMLWKSPHSILSFLRHLPEILAFEMKQ